MPGPPGAWYCSMMPGAGTEVVGGVLGVDPELDGMAAGHDVRLAQPQRLAGGDPDLEGHEVDAGEHLGDRVLDLDPAVDLDEVRVAGAVDEELEGADVLVARGHDGPNRRLRQGRAGLRRQRRRRRLLEDLLVAPLDGAVALAEVDAGAEPVDRDLDLDVAVVVEPLLEVDRVVAERGLRLGAADLDRRLQLPRGPDHPHALAAAAGGRLDEHRVADPVGFAERVVLVADHRRARDRRQPEPTEQAAGALLRGEPVEHVGRRPDEGQVVGANDLGEGLVLAQEAVARVDRVAAGHERGGDRRPAPRGTTGGRRAARCRSPRRRAARGGSRDPPRCTRRRPRSPGSGRHG